MTRIERLLLRIRDTLADPDAQRWSDTRLLRLLDEAQVDICRRAKLLRTKLELNVFDGQAEYTMPEDFLLLDKVSINGEAIPLIGHSELFNYSSKWEDDKGRVKFVVFDKQMRGKIRLYPIPDYNNGDRLVSRGAINPYTYQKIRDKYGCLADTPIKDTFPNGVYGVTTDIEGVFQYIEEPLGMPKVFNKQYKMLSKYGIVTNITFNLAESAIASPNVGMVTAIGRTPTTTSAGNITGLETSEEFDTRTSDNTGTGTIYDVNPPKVGYFTQFIKYGDITSGSENVQLEDKFGIASITSANPESIQESSPYGIVTSITLLQNTMSVYYIRKPKELESVESEIEIDSSLDSALKYYVCGKAFRDDLDTQNRAMGNEELSLYERELTEAMSDDTLNFTRDSSPLYEIAYNGGLI